MINFRVKTRTTGRTARRSTATRPRDHWTIIPTILVTAVAVVSAIVLTRTPRPATNPLTVTAIGQQFAWTFRYAERQVV